MVSESGSAKTVNASTNEMPCFDLFAAALPGSHSNLIIAGLYWHRFLSDGHATAQPPFASARLVPAAYLWKLWKTVVIALGTGALTGLLVVIIEWRRLSPWPFLISFIIVCLFVAILGHRIRYWYHLCLFVMFFWVSLPATLALLIFLQGQRISAIGLPDVLLSWMLLSQPLCVAIWVLVRNLIASPKVEPSLCCPRCSYDLIGNTSGRCPKRSSASATSWALAASMGSMGTP